MTEASPSKGRAARFAADARELKWDTVEIDGDVFEQSDSRATLPVDSVVARRGSEVVTATWVDGWALGPIGWHCAAAHTHPLKNAASARRCLASALGHCS